MDNGPKLHCGYDVTEMCLVGSRYSRVRGLSLCLDVSSSCHGYAQQTLGFEDTLLFIKVLVKGNVLPDVEAAEGFI